MITREGLRAIRDKHGISFKQCRRLSSTGRLNDVYLLDEKYVLRVPKEEGNPIEQLRRESIALPAARDASVRAPELIAYNPDRGLLGLPYLIVQFIPGRDFESLKRAPTAMPEMWQETGRQLAKLHASSVALKPPSWAARYSLDDPFPHIDRRVSEGHFSAEQAEFLKAWARKLERTIQNISLGGEHFVHADVQMSNLVVTDSGSYAALIDWGCALMCRDVSVDFVSMPLSAVTLVLEGYLDQSDFPENDTLQARIVWRRIWDLAIDPPRNDSPSWYCQTSGREAEPREFFRNPPSDVWAAVGPPVL